MKTLWFVGLVVASLGMAGCNGPAPKSSGDDAAVSSSEHHHDHGDLGPHGGHLLHLEPAGVHAEWTHDEDSKAITVYLDDLNEAKIKEVKFEVKVGEADAEAFPLTKVESGWTITNDALMTHLNMGKAAEVRLVVDSEDGPLSTQIEHEEHEHHH